MKNILIFRSDKFGDLINSSAVYKNIKENYPDSTVDLVCSRYNYFVIFWNIFKKFFYTF